MDVTSDYKQSTTESQSNIKALKLSGLMERQERVRLLYNQGMNPSASDVSIAVKDIGWVSFIFIDEYNYLGDSWR